MTSHIAAWPGLKLSRRLGLANLGVVVLDDETHWRANVLSPAWEAANAWAGEPDYAAIRLAALRDEIR